jgi:hypothetical protein
LEIIRDRKKKWQVSNPRNPRATDFDFVVTVTTWLRPDRWTSGKTMPSMGVCQDVLFQALAVTRRPSDLHSY